MDKKIQDKNYTIEKMYKVQKEKHKKSIDYKNHTNKNTELQIIIWLFNVVIGKIFHEYYPWRFSWNLK
jgi:hypothetical protein